MAGITAIQRKGFRGGGMDMGNQSNQNQSANSTGTGSNNTSNNTSSNSNSNNSNNNNNQNTGNDNNDMQNYMLDQTTYTANNTPTNTTISDQDAKDFFDARPDYKAAAEQAAKKKAEEKAEAKKEKDRIDAILAELKDKEPVAYSYGNPIKNYKKNYFTGPNKFSTATKMRQLALKNLIDKKMGNKNNLPSIFEMNNLFNPSMVDQDYTYNSGITTDMMGADLQDYSDISDYGMTGKNLTDIDRMNRALDTGRETGKITQQQFEDAFNNQVVPVDLSDDTILPYPFNVQEPEPDPYNQFTYNEEAFGPGGKSADVRKASYDFNEGGRAGGGIMGTRARKAFGGIMDRVTGRKAYGLGSIFKSVKKAVGKVLKSPIGKAAMIYAGGAMLGSYGAGKGFFSPGMFNPGNMGKGLLGLKGKYDKLGTFGKIATMGGLGLGLSMIPGLNKAKPNETNFSDRGGPLLNSQGDGSQGSISREIQEAYASGDSQRIMELQKYYNYMLPSQDAVQDLSLPSSLPYPNYAEGGRIGKAEGGLLNMGGMEKDYRNDGGFVPIGEYEKKDDVPARLSVNEFVFTADAVRNAGEGDIDKGAEVMENMMKNLENGGTVSEESQGNQGNTGAQDMFSVSQRLGEVI